MRPSYAWQALHNRLTGLEQSGERSLRIDYGTEVHFGPDREYLQVSLYEEWFARITPTTVTVWHPDHNPTLHRRLNEVLRPVGWAVVERAGEWSLVRREDDGGVAHPFPALVKATVAVGEAVPTYYVGERL